MTASVTNSPNSNAGLASANNDGGGLGFTITTPSGMSGKRVLALVGVSANGNTITAPATGTWAQVTLPDNVITTSGGQFRLYEGSALSDSTTYTWSFTSGRQTAAAVVIDSFDASGGSMVDVASSLESAAGSTHAPPSVTPNASSELVVDFLGFRHFAPDTSTGSPPSTGLTWTEVCDKRGTDSNNNIQINIGWAVAGSSGVAVSAAPWNTDDPFEPALVIRVLIKSAGGGSQNGAAALTSSPTLTAAAVQTALGAAALTASPTLTAAATRVQPAAAALSSGSNLTAAATRVQPATAALASGSTLTVAGTIVQPASAALSFGSTLTAAATAVRPAAVALSASPVLAAAAGGVQSGAAALSSSPVLTSAASTGPVVPYRTATLTPGALTPATFTPSVLPAGTWTPGVLAPATFTPSNL